MKRKIVVEIDCKDTVCGNCEHNNGDYCPIFNDALEFVELQQDYSRCEQCLDAGDERCVEL